MEVPDPRQVYSQQYKQNTKHKLHKIERKWIKNFGYRLEIITLRRMCPMYVIFVLVLVHIGVDPARVRGPGPSWNFASEGPPLFGPSQNFTESSHVWSTVMKHSEHNLSQCHFQSSIYCQMRIIKPRIMHRPYTVRIHLELLSSAVSEQFNIGLSAAI